MTYTTFFNKEFTMENVGLFLGELDGILAPEDGRVYEEVDIYFDSPGGLVSAYQFMARYLEKYPIPFRIILAGHCASATMMLALRFAEVVMVETGTLTMFHLSSSFIDSRELNYKYSSSTIVKNDESIDNELLEMMSKLKFTEEEINQIKEGHDVYVPSERMALLFEAYQVEQAIAMQEAAIEEIQADTALKKHALGDILAELEDTLKGE